MKVSRNKLEGPTTQFAFLGIWLDMERLEVRLPEEKMERLRQLIQEWKKKHSCTKRELLSLLGVLNYACQVVKPGRSFLRRIVELSKVVKKNHHHIQLNNSLCSDLEWWATFLPVWNGVGMLSNLCHRPHTVAVTSDASGGWGCGAYSTGGQWFQFVIGQMSGCQCTQRSKSCFQ